MSIVSTPDILSGRPSNERFFFCRFDLERQLEGDVVIVETETVPRVDHSLVIHHVPHCRHGPGAFTVGEAARVPPGAVTGRGRVVTWFHGHMVSFR
jgi:hypothetical protein